MKTRIEFTGFVDVYGIEAMDATEARRYVQDALLLGSKHADAYCAFIDGVKEARTVGDDE